VSRSIYSDRIIQVWAWCGLVRLQTARSGTLFQQATHRFFGVNGQSGACVGIICPNTKSDVAIEKEGPMTRKLATATAIAVIALTSAVGIGTAEAHGFGGGGFHGGFGGFRGGFGRDGRFFGRGFYGFGFAPYYGYGGYYGPGCYGYRYAPYGCYGGYGY
jgi:hypothetical protein